MHETATGEACPPKEIPALVALCLRGEQDRHLSAKSLQELRRYLNAFADHCREHSVVSGEEITADFLRAFVEKRCKNGGPSLKKAVVWALQRLGSTLHLLQVVRENPAQRLRYPKMHPRSEIPEYLSEPELQRLLEDCAIHGTLTEFAILSLIAATGLRPKEVARLSAGDIFFDDQCMQVRVKGGWIKKTALSCPLISILKAYLATRSVSSEALFVTSRSAPASVSFLQRSVKEAGKRAGLAVSLNCNILRHSFATHAADSFGSVVTKALMGHQLLSTTAVYTHLSPRRFKSVMRHHPLQRRRERSRS